MNLKSPKLSLRTALVAGVILLPALHAAQVTWVGNNSTDLRDTANWSGGIAPVANTDSMLFNAAGTAGANLVNPASGNNIQYVGNFTTSTGAIQFNASAPSYTFNGTDLRLGDGGLWNQSSGTVQTFNTLIRLNTTNSFTFNASYANTTLNGNLDLSQGVGSRIITVAFRDTQGSVFVINGNITNSNATPGTGSLTLTSNASVNSTGTVILGGDNASLNGTVTLVNTVGSMTGLTLNSTTAIRNVATITTNNVNAIGRLRYNAGSSLTYTGSAPALVGGGISSSPTLDINLDAADQQFSSAALAQKGIYTLSTTSGSNQKLTVTGATTFGVNNGSQSAVLNPIGNAAYSIGAVSPVAATSVNVSTLVLGGLSTQNEITGAISNSTNNTVVLVKAGAGTWTLKGNNSSLTGSTANVTLAGGKLALDYSTNDNSKFSDTGALFLQGGTLELSGGTHTEVVGNTTLNLGGTQITRPSGTATINLGAIAQTAGALNISGNNIAITSTANTNGRLGGLSRITVGSGTSYSFAKNDGSNNIVGMADSDYTALAATSGSNAIVYNLDGNLTYTGASTTIGSLRIRPTGAGQSLIISGTNAPAIGNSTTGAGAGAILFAGSDDYSIVNNSTGNALRASTGALLVHQWGTGNLTITGTGNATGVILSSQIDKFGSGRLIISGNNSNTSTTAATIGGGILQVASNAALGNQTTGGALSLQGGTFVGDTSGGSFALNNSGSNSRNVTVGLTGGGIDVIGGNTLTVSGVISSTTTGTGSTYSAPLTLGSASTNGTIVLSGTSTYTGGTILRGGTVEIQNASALGAYALATAGQANNFIQFTGGTLRYGTGITTDLAQRIRYSTSSININTNGQSVTYSNDLDYTNTGGLTKLGTGTLSLNGTNTFSGGTTVSAGTLAANNRSALGAGGVTINSGAALTTGVANVQSGDFSSAGNFTLNGASAGTISLTTGADLLLTGGTWFYSVGDQFVGTSTSIFTISGVTLDLNGVGYGTYVLATGFQSSGNSVSFGGFSNLDPSATTPSINFDNGILTLTVVPEPSTYALGMLGLLGLIILVRRRPRAV